MGGSCGLFNVAMTLKLKFQQGEYVAVKNLENVFGNNSVIDSVWIYGSNFESFLVAVVNPSKQQVEKWAKQNGLSGD
ncbi:hypothetical protein H5410_037214, partial [Solanum commersonii]